MSNIEEIEDAVSQLAPGDLAKFRAWFDAFDTAQFDARIERDTRDGVLDGLADKAMAAHRNGQTRDL